jgi:hypothetical protein
MKILGKYAFLGTYNKLKYIAIGTGEMKSLQSHKKHNY